MKLLEIKGSSALGDDNPYIPKKMSGEDIIKWCEKNASQYLARASKNPIFRGFGDVVPVLGLINTDKMNRVSANTHNYYTLWMDNYSAWGSYPKRSKSLICSTNYNTARGFSGSKSFPQFIIPKDSNKIGICSEDDLWLSFKRLDDIGTLNTFANQIHGLIKYSYDEAGLKEAKTYAGFIKLIKGITRRNVDDERYFPLAKEMSTHKLKNLYEALEYLLDPNGNDFELVTASTMKHERDNEVWVQGECATIDIMHGFSKPNDPKNELIYQFVNDYKLNTFL